jgi:hypothetical protein
MLTTLLSTLNPILDLSRKEPTLSRKGLEARACAPFILDTCYRGISTNFRAFKMRSRLPFVYTVPAKL